MSLKVMKTVSMIVLPILIVLGAYTYGYKSGSKNVKTPEKETKIEYVDRIIEKEVKVYIKQKVKEDTKTTINKPDGTVVVIENKKDTESSVDSSSKDTTKEKIIVYDKVDNGKDWTLSLKGGIPLKSWREFDPVFGAEVDRKITNSIGAGVWYMHTSDKLVGASISVRL